MTATRLAGLLFVSISLSACETAPDKAPAAAAPAAADTSAALGLSESDVATATLAPLDSSGVSGTVSFRRIGDATEIRYTLAGLAAGTHGFHLHEHAACGADSTGVPGSAAGAHFNPMASPHGAPAAALTGRHAGDFGNVTADAAGRAEGIVIDSVLTFEGPTNLVGHAVIVHEKTDDLATQPGGDSGGRLACGVTAVPGQPN